MVVTLVQKMVRGWLTRLRFRKTPALFYGMKILRFLVAAKFKKRLRRLKSAVVRLQYLFRRRCRLGRSMRIQEVATIDQPSASVDDVAVRIVGQTDVLIIEENVKPEAITPSNENHNEATSSQLEAIVESPLKDIESSTITVFSSILAEPMESSSMQQSYTPKEEVIESIQEEIPTDLINLSNYCIESSNSATIPESVTESIEVDVVETNAFSSILEEQLESPYMQQSYTNNDEKRMEKIPKVLINSTIESKQDDITNPEPVKETLVVVEQVENSLNNIESKEEALISRLLDERRRSRTNNLNMGGGGAGSRSDTLMFRSLQDQLHSKINELIDSFRITAKEALLRFDLREARRSLETWANKIPPGDVRTRMKAVADAIDYGYNLITANKIIPLVMAAKFMNIGSSKPENRIISARSANKLITKDHDMFGTISFLLKELEWLANGANREKERLSSIIAANRTKRGDSVVDKAYIYIYIYITISNKF